MQIKTDRDFVVITTQILSSEKLGDIDKLNCMRLILRLYLYPEAVELTIYDSVLLHTAGLYFSRLQITD